MTKQSIQQHQFNAFDFTILLLCGIVPVTLVLFIALKICLSRRAVFVLQKFLRSPLYHVPLVITSITENNFSKCKSDLQFLMCRKTVFVKQ